MRDYGIVTTRLWIDENYQTLSVNGKLMFVYLLTGPHTTALGCFRLPKAYIAADLNWSQHEVHDAIQECASLGFLQFDESGWFFIPKFLKWNPVQNRNQWINVKRLFDLIPEGLHFYEALLLTLKDSARHAPVQDIKGFETLLKPFRNQEQEQKPEQEQDQEPDPEHACARAGETVCDEKENDKTDESMVFTHWCAMMQSPNAQFDEKRKQLIEQALSWGYTVDQLCKAISGCAKTPHNMGMNDKGQKYNHLSLILRDADQIDRFIKNNEEPPQPGHSTIQTNRIALAQWVQSYESH